MTMDPTVFGETRKKRREVKLSAQEVRGLYYLKEPHMEELLAAAILLDESDRKLAVEMLQAMLDHRRSRLS